MYKQTITQANLEKFVLSSIVAVHPDVESDLVALATIAALTVVAEHGGQVGVEPIASEWAQHDELKSVAAACRAREGNTRARVLNAIGGLCAARAIPESQRLALVQRLAAWTPESTENLDELIAQANLPELPLTFERGWHLATNHYSSMPYKYEQHMELGKRIWNFATDAALATAQPVAAELMDSLDAIRSDYVRQSGEKQNTELLARMAAAIEKLDVLSIPYAALDPVIEVRSEIKGNVNFIEHEKVLRVVRQNEPGSYIAVIEGKTSEQPVAAN